MNIAKNIWSKYELYIVLLFWEMYKSFKICRMEQIIQKTENYVRTVFEEEGSGHDWWHIHRVRILALKIAEQEGGDLFLIEMGALMHDLDDWKLNSGESRCWKWLQKIGIEQELAQKIVELTEQISFKGAGVADNTSSLEAKIVQDADRIDAIGAIGIARTFAYGGNKGRLLYHPEIKPEMHQTFAAYKSGTSPTINHFYEKLLLLKERVNTKTGKKIAEKRHAFMEKFLEQFFNEWEGIF